MSQSSFLKLYGRLLSELKRSKKLINDLYNVNYKEEEKMRIIDLLDSKSIHLNGHASDKKDVLDKMVELMNACGKIAVVETYRLGVYAREA